MPEASLDSREGLLLEEVGQSGSEHGEADGEALFEGPEGEILHQRGLADAARAPEQGVVGLADEFKGKKLLVEIAVDRARMVPVEAIEGGKDTQGSDFRASREVACVALPEFDYDELFGELGGRQAALGRVGNQRGKDVAAGAYADAAETIENIATHRSPRDRGE